MTEELQQQRTTFTHHVSFHLLTHIDMAMLEATFAGFLQGMDKRVAEGLPLNEAEAQLVELCKAGNYEQAVKVVVQTSFTDYLISALEIAAQSVSSEHQETEFKDIAVTFE